MTEFKVTGTRETEQGEAEFIAPLTADDEESAIEKFRDQMGEHSDEFKDIEVERA